MSIQYVNVPRFFVESMSSRLHRFNVDALLNRCRFNYNTKHQFNIKFTSILHNIGIKDEYRFNVDALLKQCRVNVKSISILSNIDINDKYRFNVDLISNLCHFKNLNVRVI